MMDKNTKTMPNPNGTPAAILAMNWMLGELVHANQNRPTVREIPPIMQPSRRASGGANPS